MTSLPARGKVPIGSPELARRPWPAPRNAVAGLSGFWLLAACRGGDLFRFRLLPPGTWAGPARGAR